MVEPRVTLVMAYYNEEGYIAETLRSLVAQDDRRFRLVLVDNMSRDRSSTIASELLRDVDWLVWEILQEQRQGQLPALRRGLAAAQTPYVATLDADTWYPPEYVGRAIGLLDNNPLASAALAFNVGEDRSRRTGGLKWILSKIWPDKCHAGGAGHCYRRVMLERAGGLEHASWPYILFDHEIAQRMRKQGPFVYARNHIIHASQRPDGSTARSWSPFERLIYKLSPTSAMDWFFYRFLAPRLDSRGLRTSGEM